MALERALRIGLLLVAILRGEPGETLWNHVTDNASSQGLLISEADFRDDRLLDIAKNALRGKRGTFLQLAILTSHRQRTAFSNVADVTVAFWRQRCIAAALKPTKIAELVSIGPDAVLRIREGLQVRHTVLAGNDPLLYRTGGSEFQFAHLALNPQSAFRLVIYARATSGFSLPAAKQLMRDLQLRLKEPSVYLVVRNDPWFSVDGRIAPCWWSAGTTVPDADAIDIAPEIRCPRLDSADSSCYGYRLE
jgi:hypothetical protein